MSTLAAQIDQAVERHSRHVALQPGFGQLTGDQRAEVRREIAAAMLSGMLLVTNYQLANDGHATATPHLVQAAVDEVGRERGLQVGKLAP